jgi:23S rRNA (cytosine1962-C5)-methyltransferase
VGSVIVRRGRAKPLWKGHPWVFSDSIQDISGDPQNGDLVSVRDDGGRIIGCGFLSRDSRIAVRILAREEHVEANAAFFVDRIQRALRLRRETLDLPVVTDSYRLVHSEGDSLPGLVVDHFAGYLVVQFSTIGMHARREAILDALEELVRPAAIFEMPDRTAARLEGVPSEGGLLRGTAPDKPHIIMEHGVQFRVGLGLGQKTGFYTDQRDNRALVGRLARGRSVLDLHTYTGGFALCAATSGASEVVGIDSSGPVLAMAVDNAFLNNVRQVRFERADVKSYLNELHGEGRRFDIVVSDPPKYAADRRSVDKALRAYRDLHLRAIRLVAEGGLLAASSCSGLVGADDFERTLREAAYDVGRSVRLLHRGGQAPDHPVLATCPEGRYLKFMLACVE